MAITIINNLLHIKNNKDKFVSLVSLAFIIVPCTLLFVVLNDSSSSPTPSFTVVVFAGAIGLISIPFLIFQYLNGKSSELVIDSKTRNVKILTSSLLNSSKQGFDCKQISNFELVTYSSGSYFYEAYIVFSNGSKFLISQGSLKPNVLKEVTIVSNFFNEMEIDLTISETTDKSF